MRKPSRTLQQDRSQRSVADPRPQSARPLELAPLVARSTGIARFDQPARRELRRLTRELPRFADLTETFPAAAYIIATRQGPLSQRRTAVQHVKDGAPLKTIAATLEIPHWLRRLPPETFRRPLPQLPGSAEFTRHISTRLPKRIDHAAHWLETLSFANTAAGETFALWLSEHHASGVSAPPERVFAILAAYAWHSQFDGPASGDFIVSPWRTEMAFDTAICAAKSWWNRLHLVMQLGEHTLADPWFEPGISSGFSILPLTSPQAILAEALEMQNCCDQFADKLSDDRCRLFSIRKGNTPVATMEVAQHPREAGVLTITQLKSKHNMPASTAVWQAAYAWLAVQSGIRRLPPVITTAHPLDQELWTHLMQPYRTQTNGAPWLPENPNLAAFGRLDFELSELSRRAGIVSWLFS